MTPLSRRRFCATTLMSLSGFTLASAMPSDGQVEPSLRLPPHPDGSARVALTLDACPGGFDDRIVRVLVQERIKATIFVTAAWIHRNPAGLAEFLAHRDLFRLENHGARHIPAVLGHGTVYGLKVAGTLDAVRQEVSGGATAIETAAGTRPGWYRDATARYSPEAIEMIEAMGLRIAGYSLNADQGASLPAASVAQRIGRARNGDVILGHVNQPLRSSGPGIAEGAVALRRQGMDFVWL